MIVVAKENQLFNDALHRSLVCDCIIYICHPSFSVFSFLFSTTPLVVNVHTVEISSGRQFQMDKDINDLVERGKVRINKTYY